MYKLIQKFLALHYHLSLPGIGNFTVETTPAELDFTNRNITSSYNTIVFTDDKLPAEKKFYSFLSQELNIDEVHAVRKFTDFTTQLQDDLKTKKSVAFKGIGTLTKQTSNVILFQPEEMPAYFPELAVERIIRKNTTHNVRVGEDDKTSDEMQTALHQPKIKAQERWWIAAIILAAIGIIAIVAYYATHPN